MSSRPERPSRYRSLFAMLAATTEDEIALTYDMVAALIGGPLPDEALAGSAWWRRRELPQVRAWRAMGWVAHASPTTLRVRFTRDAEGG
jgi:hypothetical protein